MLEGSVISLIPLAINFAGFTLTSRVLLCWITSLFTLYAGIILIREMPAPETSNYIGSRFLLIAFSTIPFLIFDLEERLFLMLGVLAPLSSIFLYDPLLNYFGLGYYQTGLAESSYEFNNIRIALAVCFIGFCGIALKNLAKRNDDLNEQLDAKNRRIKEQAEELVRALEHKFSKVFHENPHMMMIVSESDHVIYDVNRKSKEVIGYEPTELIGKTKKEIRLFVNDGDREQFFEQYFTNGKADLECHWRKKNGERAYVSISASQMEISGVKYISAVVQDISEKKLAEANLQSTIHNTGFFIWSVDTEFRLLSFNKPFAAFMKKMFQVDLHPGFRILGPYLNLPQWVNLWETIYRRAFAGEAIKFEDDSLGVDYEYSLNPITEGGQVVGVSAIASDVSERKKNDRILAEANKKINELKMKSLRSVMNPHFIFNVLNSIQFFIGQNDRLSAINYLATFSKLIRMVLTHSVANRIRLHDELEMAQNYVELERMRFDNKFECTFELAEELDTRNIYIPSFLVQPYIENSILHGLYKKDDGQGKLVVRVLNDGEYVVFEVEDNGIGRAASAQLKHEGTTTHKSMGTSLTEERLKILNAETGLSVIYEDLHDNDIACGTKVTIMIKYSGTPG
jgi:PAS domain S-box-containing protein